MEGGGAGGGGGGGGGGDLTCPARETILRARDGDNSLIQYGILSVLEADFLIGGPSFCAHYSCSMY